MMRPVRDWNVDQSMPLPVSVHDFLPSDHVAHFIRGTVAEELDLSAAWQAYGGDRGLSDDKRIQQPVAQLRQCVGAKLLELDTTRENRASSCTSVMRPLQPCCHCTVATGMTSAG